METVSLYRKYRPHNFDNLVGQDHIKSTLVNAIKNERVSHAYLFTGPRGTGKTSTARLLAKALCCSDMKDGYEPCDECEFCKDINDGRLIDLIEIDAASNRGIDEVRDLKEKIGFAPSRSQVKIYIIDEVHMMTKEAFNALLKTLEEPPSHAYFILATTESHKVPETIISRCQRFDFRRIDKKALMTRLSYICQKEDIKADDTALELISRYVDGGMRDAIGLVEQLTVERALKFDNVHDILGVTDLSTLENLYKALVANDTAEALKLVNQLHSQGSDLKQFVHEFVDVLREKMLDAVNDDRTDEVGRLISMIEVFQEAPTKYESSIPQLPLEIAAVKITSNLVPVTNAEVEISDEKIKPVKVEEALREHKDIRTVEAPVAKAPATIEEAEAKKEETEENVPLTISHLKDKWPRITERVKKPSLKMSVKNAVPAIVDDFKVTLQFNTKFHRDKVIEHDNRIELENLIKIAFGKPVKITGIVKELELKSVVEDKPRVAEPEVSEDDLADQALEIFGGELVE